MSSLNSLKEQLRVWRLVIFRTHLKKKEKHCIDQQKKLDVLVNGKVGGYRISGYCSYR